MHLEDDLAVWRHGDTISVGESQGLVVVQDGVEILNPDGVYRAVKNQPYMLTLAGKKFDIIEELTTGSVQYCILTYLRIC